MTRASRSRVASSTSSPTPADFWSSSSSMPPTFRTATAHPMFSRPSVSASRGCAMSLPMAAMRGKNSGTHSRAMEAGRWRSSSARIPPRVSCFYHGAGWSNALSHGSAGAAAWPRTGRNPSLLQPHGPPSPASECSRAESQVSQLIDELLNRALRYCVTIVRRARLCRNGADRCRPRLRRRDSDDLPTFWRKGGGLPRSDFCARRQLRARSPVNRAR